MSILICVALFAVAFAQSATIFPGALGPDTNLHGEIVGTGEDGTTYVLSGETRGIAFTCKYRIHPFDFRQTTHRFVRSCNAREIVTLAEDASHIQEEVSVPSLSVDLNIGCDISAGSAVCENVAVVGDTLTSTLPLTTLPFSPFAVPVSTSGVLPSSITSAPESVSTADVDC